jgi:hypothetical protein
MTGRSSISLVSWEAAVDDCDGQFGDAKKGIAYGVRGTPKLAGIATATVTAAANG